jgi:hypothetical protein
VQARGVFELYALDHQPDDFLPVAVEMGNHAVAVVFVPEDGDEDVGIAQIRCAFDAGDRDGGGVEV